jgi:hypothetical protein
MVNNLNPALIIGGCWCLPVLVAMVIGILIGRGYKIRITKEDRMND